MKLTPRTIWVQFAIAIILAGIVLLLVLPFPLELVLRAFRSSALAMGYTELAVYSAIAVSAFSFGRRLVTSGLRNMKWKEAVKDFGGGLFLWCLGVFSYQLIYTIPHEITVQAENSLPSWPPKKWPKPSLAAGWDTKFIQPFCYVLFETSMPHVVLPSKLDSQGLRI